MAPISNDLRQQVWSRAGGHCEYCQVPYQHDPLAFAVDHIRPQYHHGATASDNLCLSCFSCNTFKAVNVAGHDPQTGALTRLYHPRDDDWSEHFFWDGPRLKGKTDIGRTTIDVLRMNLPERAELRRLLMELGLLPT